MPETAEIQKQSISLIEQAKAIKIVSNEDYAVAGEFLIVLKKMVKEIEATFKEPKSLANALRDSLCKAENNHADPVRAAIKLVGDLMSDHKLREERLKRDEERRLKLEADERAAIARKQLEEERLQNATQLQDMGLKDEALDVLDQPMVIPPSDPEPVERVLKVEAKAQGVSARAKYTIFVTNEALISREYLMPDLKKLQKIADAMGEKTNIPGTRVEKSFIMSGRTKY